MRAIPTEQLANTLNHAFKELIRRQQHVIGEFDKLGIEFFKHIEKTADARTYQPILEMFQILNTANQFFDIFLGKTVNGWLIDQIRHQISRNKSQPKRNHMK